MPSSAARTRSHRAEQPGITDLDLLLEGLSSQERTRFGQIFEVHLASGQLVPPETMHAWIAEHFGSVEAALEQRIVKITNLVTHEGSLFNELRARRPLQAPPGGGDLEEIIHNTEGGSFCHPEEATPADAFGRLRGQHAITASNIAKYDGWHGVVIFDDHDPLRFTAEQVTDYIDTAQAWAKKAHQADPQACYPFFLWNCLWRSGASILHGHAQMTVTRGSHYVKIEALRQAARRYREQYTTDYFTDLIETHRALGLAIDQGTASILPSLTPLKEKETLIIASELDDYLKAAIYYVLRTFIEQFGMQSFNLALYQRPLVITPEPWEGFPTMVRLIDRGRLQDNTSDLGAMELFAQSVVASDPFRVAAALASAQGSRG
jgi:galactose-1-phosphate uridylyltransferase